MTSSRHEPCELVCHESVGECAYASRQKPRRVRSERSPLHDVRQHARASALQPTTRANSFSRTSISQRRSSTRRWLANRSAESAKVGGARRDRTDDLLLAKQALSQLSYGPAVSGNSS